MADSVTTEQGPSLALFGQSDERILEDPVAVEGYSLEGQQAAGPKPHRSRDRTSRKRVKQKQFQRALASMLESFPGIFEDSDADVSDFDDNYPHADEAGAGDPYSRSQSDSGSASPSYRRSRRPRPRPGARDAISITSHGSDPIDIVEQRLSGKVTTLNEADMGPIEYETELWHYIRVPAKDFDEPELADTARTPAPLKVSRVGAHAKSTETTATDLVFKAVSMYAVPRDVNKRGILPKDPLGARAPYTYGRPEEPVVVNASMGAYLLIYSEVIMRAIRSCVKVYPGISGASEFMSVPAPYTLIVHYRDELQAYNDGLPDELNEVPSPTTELNDTNQESDTPKPNLSPKEHMPLLLDYVFTPEFTTTYDHEMSLRKKPTPTTTYALAWMLFRPGSMVYAWSGNSLDAYVVDSYELEGLYSNEKNKDGKSIGLVDLVRPPHGLRGELPEFSTIPKSLVIKLHYVEYDGTRIGRRLKTVTIMPFDGEQEIGTLAAFPVEYAQDTGLRDRLMARGQKYFELCQRHYMSYSGDTIAVPGTSSRKLNGRVMIDSAMYYNDPETAGVLRLKMPTNDGVTQSDSSSASDSSNASDTYRRRRKKRTYGRRLKDLKKKITTRAIGMFEYDLIEPGKANLKPEHFMLFPVQIWGFVLRERRWYLLHIDGLKEPQFQENIINDLVLKDEARILIEALSSTHDQNTEGFNHWSADIVQNKGEGRIFLLHGKPGVGKTSTAECVAEANGAPLLAITCGDLGTHPLDVERSLMKWFKLATVWKAVLLLDEADVYLESRMSGDLARNSLVSIFLRALEYYQGVLFLTTNRVGTFDEAMLSRIHVVLHYADFEDSERQKIWTTSFRKLGEERPEVKVGPGVMDYALENQRVLDLKWNGREIRNAFNTIVALAEFDAEKKRRAGRSGVQVSVERSHLVQVVKMSEGFKSYMKSTRGLDESALAKALKIRDDTVVGRNQTAVSRNMY